MSTQSYHISKQVLISAAKAFMDECKSTGIVPDQTVQSISKGTFNVRKEIGLKKKRAEIKRLRRKMIEERRDKEMSDAKEKKLRNLETDITTKMAKVNLNTCDATHPYDTPEGFGTAPQVCGAFGTPKHTPTNVTKSTAPQGWTQKVIKPRYISVPHPTDPDTTILERVYTTSPDSSFDDSVLDPDYNPPHVVDDL